jgi:hypothetical protein
MIDNRDVGRWAQRRACYLRVSDEFESQTQLDVNWMMQVAGRELQEQVLDTWLHKVTKLNKIDDWMMVNIHTFEKLRIRLLIKTMRQSSIPLYLPAHLLCPCLITLRQRPYSFFFVSTLLGVS